MTVDQQLPIGSNIPSMRLAWHPTQNMLALGESSTVRLKDVSTGELLRTFPQLPDFVTDIKWNSDGTRLAIATSSEIQIWDDPSNEILNQPSLILKSLDAKMICGIIGISWHPNITQILGVVPPYVNIWDTTSGQGVGFAIPMAGPYFAATWSNDGQKIMEGDSSGGILVMNRTDKTGVYGEVQGNEAIYALAWSPSDDRIAAGNGAGIIKIFMLEPSFTDSGYIETQMGKILSLSWNPIKTNLVASGASEGKVVVWDVNTLGKIVEVQAMGSIVSTAWSPDGRLLAYGDESGLNFVAIPD